MGWSDDHRHAWVVYEDVEMMVEGELIDETNGDFIVEIPFCVWICRCGAWKWRLSPRAEYREGYVEI